MQSLCFIVWIAFDDTLHKQPEITWNGVFTEQIASWASASKLRRLQFSPYPSAYVSDTNHVLMPLSLEDIKRARSDKQGEVSWHLPLSASAWVCTRSRPWWKVMLLKWRNSVGRQLTRPLGWAIQKVRKHWNSLPMGVVVSIPGNIENIHILIGHHPQQDSLLHPPLTRGWTTQSRGLPVSLGLKYFIQFKTHISYLWIQFSPDIKRGNCLDSSNLS